MMRSASHQNIIKSNHLFNKNLSSANSSNDTNDFKSPIQNKINKIDKNEL